MPRLGKGHPGDAQELASCAAPGDEGDVVAPHAELPRQEAQQFVVRPALEGRSRQAHAKAVVGDTVHLASARPRRHPDGEAQTVPRLRERPAVTT